MTTGFVLRKCCINCSAELETEPRTDKENVGQNDNDTETDNQNPLGFYTLNCSSRVRSPLSPATVELIPVHHALATIFNLNTLEKMSKNIRVSRDQNQMTDADNDDDDYEEIVNVKDFQSSASTIPICFVCYLVLTDLYRIYTEFSQLRKANSFLGSKLKQLENQLKSQQPGTKRQGQSDHRRHNSSTNVDIDARRLNQHFELNVNSTDLQSEPEPGLESTVSIIKVETDEILPTTADTMTIQDEIHYTDMDPLATESWECGSRVEREQESDNWEPSPSEGSRNSHDDGNEDNDNQFNIDMKVPVEFLANPLPILYHTPNGSNANNLTGDGDLSTASASGSGRKRKSSISMQSSSHGSSKNTPHQFNVDSTGSDSKKPRRVKNRKPESSSDPHREMQVTPDTLAPDAQPLVVPVVGNTKGKRKVMYVCPAISCSSKVKVRSNIFNEVLQHMKDVHGVDKDLKLKFLCPHKNCFHRYDSKTSLREHLVRRHPQDEGGAGGGSARGVGVVLGGSSSSPSWNKLPDEAVAAAVNAMKLLCPSRSSVKPDGLIFAPHSSKS